MSSMLALHLDSRLATVPRYRSDQLMRLGWRIFLPISLIWVFLVSGFRLGQRVGFAA